MALSLRQELPLTLPPGRTNIQLNVEPGRQGHFGQQLHFYIDDGHLRELFVDFAGTAVGRNDGESAK